MTKKTLAALIVAAVMALMLAVPVLAGNGPNGPPSTGDRPGWGYGDTNHNHTGPPGLSQSAQ